MPAILHPGFLASRDEAADSASEEVGQRISIEGGISSSTNIIALLIAICKWFTNMIRAHHLKRSSPVAMFIAVVVAYQYLTIEITRRESGESSRARRARRRHARCPDAEMVSLSIAGRAKNLCKAALNATRKRFRSQQRPLFPTSSNQSLSTLLKIPSRAPPKTSFLELPCFRRSKKQKTPRDLRPLCLNRKAAYVPRSGIDPHVQEFLRSPNAFSEISDPIRSMSFVREREEYERRNDQSFDLWNDSFSPGLGPEKPKRARQAIEPILVKTKIESSLKDRVTAKDAVCYEILVQDDGSNNPSLTPSPSTSSFDFCERYSPRPLSDIPEGSPISTRSSYLSPSTSTSSRSMYDSSVPASPSSSYLPRPLSSIDEESEHPQPRSFFDIDDSDEEEQPKEPRRRKRSLRFRFPTYSGSKSAIEDDGDVYRVGSLSSWGSLESVAF